MSTITLSRRRIASIRTELDRWTLLAAGAVFTLLAVAHKTGAIGIPGGVFTLALFPLTLLAVDLSRPHLAIQSDLRWTAGWSALVLAALQFTPFLTRTSAFAIGIPLVLAISLLAARRPAAATVAVASTTAAVGSFEAFLGFSPSTVIDLGLATIWFAVLGRTVVGRPYSFAAWPAVLGCVMFIGLTAVDMLTAENFSLAYLGFKTTIWYMLVFLAIAYAGWSRETYRRIALGLAALTVIVAAYGVLRWVIGPAEAERELASITANQINVDPIDKSLRVVGSFQTAHQMAFWAAFMGPFCLAVGLWAEGRWRFLALLAPPLCLTAIIASEVRGPLPGFVVGVILVLAIHQGARAFTGFKAGVALLVVGSTVALGGGAITLAASDPQRLDRFEAILDPASDPTFIKRQLKWEAVLDSVEEHPFGRGLGTGGAPQLTAGETVELAEFNIDNTYLKIAYEQGLFTMLIFIVVVAGLLLSLALASLRTTSRQAAALGMGACGALASVLVSFYTGLFIESLPIVSAWIVVGLGLSCFVARPAERPQVPTT
jgi:hypothetical protein